MRFKLSAATLAGLLATAGVAVADFAKIDDRAAFLDLVEGKTLKRPFVSLKVTPTGAIVGRGAQWDVTGQWQWQNGYFCRDLYWGGDDLGYNCQQVSANGNRIRFTSDRGSGDSADFRLQ